MLVAELRTNFCIRSLRLVKVLAVLLLIWGCVAKSRMQWVDLARICTRRVYSIMVVTWHAGKRSLSGLLSADDLNAIRNHFGLDSRSFRGVEGSARNDGVGGNGDGGVGNGDAAEASAESPVKAAKGGGNQGATISPDGDKQRDTRQRDKQQPDKQRPDKQLRCLARFGSLSMCSHLTDLSFSSTLRTECRWKPFGRPTSRPF